MPDTPISLEPLADYLKPHFGNIYDWDNIVVPYVAVDGFDVQPWTDEAQQVVRNYLLHETPEHLLELAFPHHKGTHPEKWVDVELEGHQPWEIALLFHETAVASLSTLDALIGHLETWPYEDDREDAIYWLEQHATELQLRQLARAVKQPDLPQRSHDLAFGLAQKLEPPELLRAWHDVVGSAPSDLTDTEWDLVKPFIPTIHGYARYNQARAAVNGILYWIQGDCRWAGIPIRYGSWQSVYQRHRNYLRSGVFALMLETLHDTVEAARLVTWLKRELAH